MAKSDLGEVGPGFTPLDLMSLATLRTLDDAGLEKGDVDSLFSASAYYRMLTLSIGEYLHIRPRYSDATNLGGSSFVFNLFHPAAAVDAGLCEVALIVYGSMQRSDSGRLVSGSESLLYEARTSHATRLALTLWPPPVMCTSTARCASNTLRSRWPPAGGRSSTPMPSFATSSRYKMCFLRAWFPLL